MKNLCAILLAVLLPLTGCEKIIEPVLPPLKDQASNAGAATPRVSGRVGGLDTHRAPIISEGTADRATTPAAGNGPAPHGPGEFSLQFADTDIREVVAQILGSMLHVTYTIDPNVRGTVTLSTAKPVSRAQLLPILQALLAQNGASLTESGSLYRVTARRAGAPGGPAGAESAAGVVVPLRYANAEDLAKVLQPYVGQGGKVLAEPGRNALLVAAEGEAKDSLLGLIKAFDIDILAGQSYALLPVNAGGVKEFAAALQESFRSQGGQLAGAVRVVPMERINSVLVISAQRAYIEAARRIYETVDRGRRQNERSWYVYYLQNGQANDVAYLLQQAFTPHNITAQPNSARAGTASMMRTGGGASGMGGSMGGGMGSGMGGSMGGGLAGGGGSGFGTGLPGGSTGTGNQGTANATASSAPGAATPAPVSTNPLLGGLDVLGVGGGGATAQVEGMRIVANDTNNALMVYATLSEYDTIKAMLRKIDIIPLQVRIDATIAEVTLNDSLQYGTQYFFKSGGINSILSNATGSLTTPGTSFPNTLTPAQAVLNTSFPGFFIGGPEQGGAPLAISALQAVTQVKVLSSPQLLVLDNQPAKLQVGSLVPYLSQQQQATIGTGNPIVNSVNYQQTGVIMQIVPRVNSGGLVTLDISQEVSEVDTSAAKAATGIASPTFQNRNVISRVVVQDGQTIGLAGLIRDSSSRSNGGIPFLKDVPLIGLLAGGQDNLRVRTELIVLITPRVMHDQRDARLLTQDLREHLINAATASDELRDTRPTGSPDPGRRIRRQMRGDPIR